MKIFFLLAIIFLSSIMVFAQEGETPLPEEAPPPRKAVLLAAPAQRGDWWVCPGAETTFYSLFGVSAGSSLAVAYGNKFSLGFKAAWFFDTSNELDALELNFLLRYYLTLSAGPYFQLTGGPALFFAKTESASIPARWGTMSAGLTFGWRFMFGKLFFAEPYIRAGYPYIVGVGVSAGARF